MRSGGFFIMMAVAHGVDAPAGLAEKGKHFLDGVNLPKFIIDPRDGDGKGIAFAEKDAESLAHAVDLNRLEASAAHADQVQAHDVVNSLLHDEGRHVLGRDSAPGEERQPADADEL